MDHEAGLKSLTFLLKIYILNLDLSAEWRKEMLCALKRHLRRDVECVLFWLGGLITTVWIRLLVLEAYGRNVKGHTLSLEMTALYILVLAFCLGIKGVRKRYNHNDDRTDNQDQYLGEVWAVLIFLTAFIIIHDYLSARFKLFGTVEMIPSQLIPSTLGIMGLFGMTKVFDVWKFVKIILKSKFPI